MRLILKSCRMSSLPLSQRVGDLQCLIPRPFPPSLPPDMSSSVFSLDACRSMIAMLDEDKNGTLNYDEFQNLLRTIAVWKVSCKYVTLLEHLDCISLVFQKMFFKFDRDRSGTLEKNEVAQAIGSLGYDLSPRAVTVLFNRFAKKRKYMNLDDFAACLSRVKIMDGKLNLRRTRLGVRIKGCRDEATNFWTVS